MNTETAVQGAAIAAVGRPLMLSPVEAERGQPDRCESDVALLSKVELGRGLIESLDIGMSGYWSGGSFAL